MPVPENQASQRIGTPCTCRSASAVVNVAGSGRPGRSTAATVARSALSRVIAASVPSGPSSRYAPVPWSRSQATPSAYRTVPRT
ncbi:hypothetical protein GCM10012284_57100 [Mangrovihabitans endophyticus]|uniref:Uncharacterized protein n=1 Tax=Mangrovihabitans endophyticus TaxID=1751298 RepID=A0A8J3FSJ5_9ACTN|nr:hypothetical protein GCM10012284_57100 [Mangrovihabitans endophyticus]